MSEFKGDLVPVSKEGRQTTVSFSYINEHSQKKRRTVPIRQLFILRVEVFLPIYQHLLRQIENAGVYNGMPQGEARELLVRPVINTLFYWAKETLDVKMEGGFQEEVARLMEAEAEKERQIRTRTSVRTGLGMQIENFALEALAFGDLSTTVAHAYEDLDQDVARYERHPLVRLTRWVAERIGWKPDWLVNPRREILAPFEERVKPMGEDSAEILNKGLFPIMGRFLEIITKQAEQRNPG